MLPFTLKQLKILKTIVAEKNLTNAAETLYLSQPSLSKQITILEKTLNVTLINRKKNQITLTDYGKILVQYSEIILALCEESYRLLLNNHDTNHQIILIGTTPTLGKYLLPKLLLLFFQNFPQVKFQISINSPSIIEKKIKNEELDIAIIENNSRFLFSPLINFEHFLYDELKLIISISHPFAKQKSIKKEDIYHLNFIQLNRTQDLQKEIELTFIHNNIQSNKLNVLFTVDSLEAIKTMVSLSFAAAFVPALSIEKEIKLNLLQIIEIKDLHMKRQLCFLKNSKSSKAILFSTLYDTFFMFKNRS